MVDFYVTADGGSFSEVDPVARAIESAGYSVQTGSKGPNAEALRNNGTVKPPTKLVFIVNGGLAGQTYGSFALDYSDGMCFTIFAFDNYRTHFSTTTEQALKTKKLVSEWDSTDFGTDAIAKDFAGHTSCSYQAKYPHIFAFIADETSAESLGKRIAQGDYTCGHGDSKPNDDNGDDEEEWDDKDNFTPHKGKIMEIRPYKQIASISFDKSYDSPTGTGEVELLYNAKDKRYVYKGVSMKLKLKRSSDSTEWSATGLEEPDYEESEKFFKEHIPTNELLEELGLPNYRRDRKSFMNTSASTGDSGSSSGSDSSDSSDSSSSSGSGGNRNPSLRSGAFNISNKSLSSSSSKPKKLISLSKAYINSLPPAQAKEKAKNTSVYTTETLKALRRRAMGLYW